jgi:hypothetical protein
MNRLSPESIRILGAALGVTAKSRDPYPVHDVQMAEQSALRRDAERPARRGFWSGVVRLLRPRAWQTAG